MSESEVRRKRGLLLSYVICIALIFGFRLFLCFQTPVSTGDVYRHLGFSSHAYEEPTTFYQMVPSDYAPEPWVSLGGFEDQSYVYPPVALVFFSGFSSFGLGIFWVKLVLLFMDLTSALLMGKFVSRLAGIIMIALPQAMWFSSREGQFEGLQSLLMIATVIAAWRRHWFYTGILFGLALQTKLLAMFLAPWLVYEAMGWSSNAHSSLESGAFVFSGTLASFLPFLPFYWGKPDLLLGAFRVTPTNYSSFFWNPWHGRITIEERWLPRWIFYCDNLGSLFIALCCLAVIVWAWNRNRTLLGSFMPFSIFWLFVKTGSYVRSWYLTLVPAFLFPLGRQHRSIVIFFLILQFSVGLQSVDFLLGHREGYLESPGQVALYEGCMYECVFQRKAP